MIGKTCFVFFLIHILYEPASPTPSALDKINIYFNIDKEKSTPYETGDANGQQVGSDYAEAGLKCAPEESFYAVYLKTQGKTDAEIAEFDSNEARRQYFKNAAGFDGIISLKEFMVNIKQVIVGSRFDSLFHIWGPTLFKSLDLDVDGSQTYEEFVATRCYAFIFAVRLNEMLRKLYGHGVHANGNNNDSNKNENAVIDNGNNNFGNTNGNTVIIDCGYQFYEASNQVACVCHCGKRNQ